MDIISAAALCITVCAVSHLLRGNGEIRLALALVCITVLLVRLAADLTSIRELISELLERTGLEETYLKVIFKGLGICYISVISSDLCRDSGQTALAAQIEIFGRLAMLITALPLFRAVIEIVEALLS